jgi:hypothetical protein
MTKEVLRRCRALGLMLMQACTQTGPISSSERAVLPPPSQSETLSAPIGPTLRQRESASMTLTPSVEQLSVLFAPSWHAFIGG